MEGVFPVVMVLVFVALAVGLGIVAHQQAKARREALAALAARLGWAFDPANDPSHDERYRQFGFFQRGHGQRAYNTLRGKVTAHGVDCPVVCGDFLYKQTSGSGKNRRTSTYRLSYMIVHLPWANTPAFSVRAENVLDKIAGAMGFDDIDFESEEFSRKFCVKGADKRFTYDLITARMMEFLLQVTPPAIECARGCLLMQTGNRTWKPDEFERMVQWAGTFLELWPEHVVDGLKGNAAGRTGPGTGR